MAHLAIVTTDPACHPAAKTAHDMRDESPFAKAADTTPHEDSASSIAFASFRSRVSNPSVNHP
jgi:hypothetical protein